MVLLNRGGGSRRYQQFSTMSSKPVLHYFDVSGRGELAKLIAATGGLEIELVEYPFMANGASAADKLKAGKMVSDTVWPQKSI